MASTRSKTAPARAAHNARLSQDLVVAENNARIWTLRVDKLRREMKSVTRPLPDPQPVRVPLGPLPCPTAQERRAAKIIQHGLSDADRFIEERLSVVVPEQAKKSPAWVKVTMNVTEKEVVIPGCPFVSDSVFELLFLVHLGPAQYITVFYHKSPEFVYSRWTGMATDREAPLWIEYQHAPAPVLWIERKEALKVVYVAEKSPYNVDSASILNLWRKKVTTAAESVPSPESASTTVPAPRVWPSVSPESAWQRVVNRRAQREMRKIGPQASPTRGAENQPDLLSAKVSASSAPSSATGVTARCTCSSCKGNKFIPWRVKKAHLQNDLNLPGPSRRTTM